MGKFKVGDKAKFESLVGDMEGEITKLGHKKIVMEKPQTGLVFKITKYDKNPDMIGKQIFIDNRSYWRLHKLNITESKMKKSELKQLIKEVLQEEPQIKEARQVWKSSEYEEIADYVSNLKDLVPYLKKEGMDIFEYTDIMGALTRLEKLNNKFGTEEID